MRGGKKFKNGLTLGTLGRKPDICTCFSLSSGASTIIGQSAQTGQFLLFCPLVFNVCSIMIVSVIFTLELYVHMCFSLLCWVSTVACYEGSCESCEESHLTQSHNDWSAETTLFLTLVALCFSEKMLGFRHSCEIFVDVTCSVYHYYTIFLVDDLPRSQSEGVPIATVDPNYFKPKIQIHISRYPTESIF